MVAMATPPLGPGNSKCLSCVPYRAAVLTIAGLTLLASCVDIVFGAVGGYGRFVECHYNYCYPTHYVWFAWTSISQGIWGFVMFILLLIGINNEIPGLLLTYIIGMILNAALYFGNGAVMLTQRQWYGDNVYYGVWAMFWSVIILYFVTVVAAYRTWMMQQRTGGGSPVYAQQLQPVPAQGIMIHPGTVFHQPMVSTVSGQIGYVQNVQPGTDLPPAYQPSTTYQTTGTHQPQGTYLPQGMFLPHGTYLSQGTLLSPGVQTQPAGQMSTGPSSLPQTGDSSK